MHGQDPPQGGNLPFAKRKGTRASVASSQGIPAEAGNPKPPPTPFANHHVIPARPAPYPDTGAGASADRNIHPEGKSRNLPFAKRKGTRASAANAGDVRRGNLRHPPSIKSPPSPYHPTYEPKPSPPQTTRTPNAERPYRRRTHPVVRTPKETPRRIPLSRSKSHRRHDRRLRLQKNQVSHRS